TTHYMDEAEYCDRVGLIYRGELIANGSPMVLKTKHMPEDVLEIWCDRPQEAMALVERQPGVKEAALFGRAMHAVVHDRELSATAIAQALDGAGFHLERLEPVTPSLEDVFVSLIEARDRRDNGTEAPA
ncbi:MAG TPA: DUF4162 domain-containing protein, partial [Acidobacteriota bacterium]|nr:DUF4162 domain-containing protein [Acidobacteriota bacterium]